MNRREALRSLLGGTVAFSIPAVTPEQKAAAEAGQGITGIGVLHYPIAAFDDGEKRKECFQNIGDQLRPGGVLCLPSTRDHTGNYDWDFVILPADGGEAVSAALRGGKFEVRPDGKGEWLLYEVGDGGFDRIASFASRSDALVVLRMFETKAIEPN